MRAAEVKWSRTFPLHGDYPRLAAVAVAGWHAFGRVSLT